MKLNKIVMGVFLACGVAAAANAAPDPKDPIAAVKDQGQGAIKFFGSIIDAPCSIKNEGKQDVPLGQVSNVDLSANDNKGTSPVRNFTIELEKCNLADKAKTVTATFTGPAGGAGSTLAMTGSAKGASIVVNDATGKLVELGKATTAQALANGNNTLAFSAYLKGDGVAIVPGDFSTIANFTLAYQ